MTIMIKMRAHHVSGARPGGGGDAWDPILYGPLTLFLANNKGIDQPAHLRSLVSAFYSLSKK